MKSYYFNIVFNTEKYLTISVIIFRIYKHDYIGRAPLLPRYQQESINYTSTKI